MRVGIIGCGKQAPKHVAGWRQNGVEEISVSDAFPAAIEALVACDGALRGVSNVEHLLADPDIQAVNICTPTPTHGELIKDAIAAGKHVFCEKPLCESSEEARDLRARVAAAEVTVMVGYIYRFVPALERAKEFLGNSSGPLGKPVSAILRLGGRGGHQLWKHRKDTGGGAINEMLVHMMDLALWYFDDGVDRVDFEVLRCDLLRPERPIQGTVERVDAEDYVAVRGRIGGCEVLLQADLVSPAFTQTVEIHGETGSFSGSIVADHPSYIFSERDWSGGAKGKTTMSFGHEDLFGRQLGAFQRAIETGKAPDRNTIDDSVRLMMAMEQVREQTESLEV